MSCENLYLPMQYLQCAIGYPPIHISEIYTVILTPLDPALQKVGGPLTPLTPWFRRHCVVRRGRLRWFGHLERKSVDDWVSACRGLVVEGARGRGRSRKTWEQCVRDDMKLLGLHPEWAIFKDMWRDLIWGKRLTLA